MSFAAALILAASVPLLTVPAPAHGARATATVGVTIVSAARIRLGDEADGPIVREEQGIHRQRKVRDRRVLVEFD